MTSGSAQTAVVTGGAAGIGQQISLRLAADGNHIVVLDVQDGSETVSLIEERGGSAEYREADVTDDESLAEALDNLSLSVLVNNAAYYAPLVGNKKRFDELEIDEWDTVMDVNAKGVFLASKHALSGMQDGGSIVNISSAVAIRGTTGFLHYVASKAAVLGMTRAMANELGDLEIRVNAITPGLTWSEASKQSGEEYLSERTQNQAIQRPIEPADIANGVAFLASEDSRMVSGQVLHIDGGSVHY